MTRTHSMTDRESRIGIGFHSYWFAYLPMDEFWSRNQQRLCGVLHSRPLADSVSGYHYRDASMWSPGEPQVTQFIQHDFVVLSVLTRSLQMAYWQRPDRRSQASTRASPRFCRGSKRRPLLQGDGRSCPTRGSLREV